MKFAYAVANVLSNFAEFRGRASLAEFWWWALFCLIVMSVLTLADGAISAPAMGFEMFSLQAGRPLSLVGALLLSVPINALLVNGLGTSASTAWLLTLVITGVGNFFLLSKLLGGRSHPHTQ